MKSKIAITSIFLLFIIFLITYFIFDRGNDGIIYINSNLKDYKVMPQDKGGIKTPNLGVYDLGQ